MIFQRKQYEINSLMDAQLYVDAVVFVFLFLFHLRITIKSEFQFMQMT